MHKYRLLCAIMVLGEFVGEITGQPRDSSFIALINHIDMEISYVTLLVADRNASTIEHYQLHD